MNGITPEQAGTALDAVDRARRQVAGEVGLPRGYWWAMAAGWVVLGGLGALASPWLAAVATVGFGAGHSVLASRLLGGRRRTGQVQVSVAVAGRRVPLVVVGMLFGLIALTIVAGFALDADGAEHASLWAALLVAAVIGFGGPETLRMVRRWVRA